MIKTPVYSDEINASSPRELVLAKLLCLVVGAGRTVCASPIAGRKKLKGMAALPPSLFP